MVAVPPRDTRRRYFAHHGLGPPGPKRFRTVVRRALCSSHFRLSCIQVSTMANSTKGFCDRLATRRMFAANATVIGRMYGDRQHVGGGAAQSPELGFQD